MKNFVEKILYWLTRFILLRRDPLVVAITGNVGKTSAKEAIAVVLAKKYTVRSSQANYNNEFGVPLTVIGATGGGRNPVKWLGVFIKALAVGFFKIPYPQMLVLEMGADKPGDIKYLTTMAPADIGMVTAITETPTHLHNFKTVEQVTKEKLVMYKHLPKLSWGIVNMDESRVTPIIEHAKFRMFTIGVDQAADLMASEIHVVFNPAEFFAATASNKPMMTNADATMGLRFKLHYQGNVVPCFLPGVVHRAAVYSALLAAATGLVSDMHLVDITAALKEYQPPRGRMRLLPGKNQSIILDDSYNAAPAAMHVAIMTLPTLPTAGRRLVCLGEMAELGEQAEKQHRAIGELLAHSEIDGLFLVGPMTRWIAEAAMKHGLPEEAIHTFTSSIAAGEMLAQLLQPQDMLLVKGSQVTRMEKVVLATMAYPEQASQVLVRQYGNW